MWCLPPMGTTNCIKCMAGRTIVATWVMVGKVRMEIKGQRRGCCRRVLAVVAGSKLVVGPTPATGTPNICTITIVAHCLTYMIIVTIIMIHTIFVVVDAMKVVIQTSVAKETSTTMLLLLLIMTMAVVVDVVLVLVVAVLVLEELIVIMTLIIIIVVIAVTVVAIDVVGVVIGFTDVYLVVDVVVIVLIVDSMTSAEDTMVVHVAPVEALIHGDGIKAATLWWSSRPSTVQRTMKI